MAAVLAIENPCLGKSVLSVCDTLRENHRPRLTSKVVMTTDAQGHEPVP